MSYHIPTPAELAEKRQIAEQKFASGRSNLLLMVALTAVNLVLLACGSGTMLLFSATIPYLAVAFAIELNVLAVGLVLAAIMLGGYLLCWWLSKRHYGWMVAALVFFLIDTAVMALLYIAAGEIGGILDVVIHIWVIYYLIIGVKYGHRLCTLPEPSPEELAVVAAAEAAVQEAAAGAKEPLRLADETAKYRVLLEGEALGHHVVYRRVKRVNELVIDHYVYDEVKLLVEGAHALKATIDGHTVEVGYDGSHSYLKVDGSITARKLRLY